MFLTAATGSRRPTELQRLYEETETLRQRIDGPYYLSDVSADGNWPDRGIYIFFDPNTDFSSPSDQWCISRIGTVGDCKGSSATLWERLRAHRGTKRGQYQNGGNHRGSVFRRHVGEALIRQDNLENEYPHWGVPHRSLSDDIDTQTLRKGEHPLEQQVSHYIRSLPFLWIDVPGEPGPDCERAMLEKNLIGLVAHGRKTVPGLIRNDWLGRSAAEASITRTGLWNLDHTAGLFDRNVIDDFREYVQETQPLNSD
jgi:hypothetical protein